MKLRTIVMISVLGIALAACGGSTKVGANSKFNGAIGKGGELGKFANDKPKAKATAHSTAKAVAKKSTDATAEAVKNASVKVRILAQTYDPYVIQAYVGSIIVFTNDDTAVHTVTGDNGEFDSGAIQPGKTWVYKANTPGNFGFSDSTHPYITGHLQVVAK